MDFQKRNSYSSSYLSRGVFIQQHNEPTLFQVFKHQLDARAFNISNIREYKVSRNKKILFILNEHSCNALSVTYISESLTIAFTSSIDNNLPPFSLNLCCMAAPTPFSNEDMTSSTSA